MRIFKFLGSGFLRSAKAWKGIIVIWFVSLILALLAGMPLKAGMKSMLGSSMITDLLKNGFNFDVFSGPGLGTGILASSFASSVTVVFLIGFILNVFLNGGLFSILISANGESFATRFFKGCGNNFWSFLLITVLLSLIIAFTAFLIIGVPGIIVSSSGDSSDAAIFRTLRSSGIIYLVILPVLLLVADYSRAWKAANRDAGSFRSIGKGFSHTFRYFFSSYPVMAAVLIISALQILLVYSVFTGIVPQSGAGIMLLYILLQGLFIIKIFARTWRYGSVTAMLENHAVPTKAL